MSKKENSKRLFKKRYVIPLSILIILSAIIILNWQTGIFSPNDLDQRDLERWNFTDAGYIIGAEQFTISGNNETCWLLVHSYTATPAEMKELAQEINKEFNDTIRVPILNGHGRVPSEIEDKNLSYWYNQIESEFLSLNNSCNKVNVVGSSFGSAISIRLTEQHSLNNVYFLNTFLYLSKPWYSIVPRGVYISIFSDFLHYSKKGKLARINDPSGLETHIAYWNMPYSPVRNSFQFISETISHIPNITENMFIAHSPRDAVASSKNAKLLFNLSSSEVKSLSWYPESDHVLLKDYNRKQLILDILKFEEENR